MIGPLGSLNVYSNAQIEEVVNQSAVCNVAQVVCKEDRSMILLMYNCSTLLAPHFKKIVGNQEVSSLQNVVFYTRDTVRNRAH